MDAKTKDTEAKPAGAKEAKAPRPRTEVTERLARHVRETRFEDLPEKAVSTAKKAFLDCTGGMLAGSKDEASQIITEYVRTCGGAPEAAVAAAGFRAPAAQAALANGVMAHALDFDDMHSIAMCHTSAVLVPTIFALADRQKSSGRDVLAAYALGFDVVYRLGGAYAVYSKAPSIHPTPKSGTIGAVCAASRLLGLDQRQTQVAIGIAGSFTGGLRGNVGTMTRPLHAGNAAYAGVVSALLAQQGFTADERTLDSEWGYSRAFGPKGADPTVLAEGLGEAFDWPDRLEFKRYPSCGKGHSATDTVMKLTREHGLTADQISAIEVEASRAVPNVMMYHRPTTGLQGKFSLEYCLAVALIDQASGLEQFTDERAGRADVQELLRKVSYIHPPGEADYSNRAFLQPERVTIRLNDGRVLSHQPESKGFSFGGGEGPDLHAKYRDCAATVLTPGAVDESLDQFLKLDELSDLSGLLQTLSTSKKG